MFINIDFLHITSRMSHCFNSDHYLYDRNSLYGPRNYELSSSANPFYILFPGDNLISMMEAPAVEACIKARDNLHSAKRGANSSTFNLPSWFSSKRRNMISTRCSSTSLSEIDFASSINSALKNYFIAAKTISFE